MAIALSGSLILSGSIIVSGSITSTGTVIMSGSIASASYALNATTGAYANTSTSASYALNATTFNGLASSIFATTGSNNFTAVQHIADTTNPTGFDSTGSLYSEGGLHLKKDAYISSSLYIKGNLTVYGTQSVSYITSSQLNISTNIITVNTSTPSIRFGGLAVQDSGSAGGLTGSLLWDSQNNSWLYNNPSGSGNYDSSLVIMGPRNSSTLGNEVGLSCNYLIQGHGHHHTTSSAIFHDGSTTCFFNTTSTTTINGGTSAIFLNSGVQNSNGIEIRGGSAGTAVNWKLEKDNTLSNAFQITPSTAAGGTTFSTPAFTLTSAVACFSGAVCAPFFSVGDGTQSNEGDAPLTIKRGVAFAGLDFKSLRTTGNIGGARFYDCAGILQAQQLIEVDGSFNFYNATSNNRFKITSTGIACFACQICTPQIQANYHSGQCMTLSSWSSNNGLILNYGNASGQVSAINLMANGTTNGFIGIQMVDGSNGDLWFGSSANRSMTVYRTTGNVGFNVDAPCTRIHSEGGYGSRWGGNGCFYGGGLSGGGMPYGDIYGNGASYTYQTCCGNANNGALYGGFAAGYFKGGPGSAYGGGGAGIVAIGGDGGNAESVNAGGGAGIFARAGKNGAGSAHSYAGWFDGGDVMVRCGSVLSCAPNNGYNFRALGFATGVIASGGSCLIFSNLDRGLYLISIASSVTSTFGYSAFLWVDSGNITVSSVIRQSCVAITTSGRYLCVVNQYTSEAASMTVTTLNLLNYIG